MSSLRHLAPAPHLASSALALTAFFFGAAAASGAATISISPSSVARGGTVTISGNVPVSGSASCPAAAAAQLTSTAALFPPDGFGPQAPRDATGDFTVGVVVPSSTPAGSYSIGIRCSGGNVGVSASLQVTGGAVATTTSTTAPATSTTRPAPSTTSAASTSLPPSATIPPAGPGTGGRSRAPLWIALAAIVVVLAGVAVSFARRRRSTGSR